MIRVTLATGITGITRICIWYQYPGKIYQVHGTLRRKYTTTGQDRASIKVARFKQTKLETISINTINNTNSREKRS